LSQTDNNFAKPLPNFWIPPLHKYPRNLRK